MTDLIPKKRIHSKRAVQLSEAVLSRGPKDDRDPMLHSSLSAVHGIATFVFQRPGILLNSAESP